MKRAVRFFQKRAFLCGLLIALQLLMMVALLTLISERFFLFYPIFFLCNIAVALWAAVNGEHISYQFAWSLVILLFPILGGIFYLISRASLHGTRAQQATEQLCRSLSVLNQTGQKPFSQLFETDTCAALQSLYIQNASLFPPYRQTTARYLSPGEEKFEAMLQALRRAERFIFLEYFIISEGEMWQQILSLLQEKAAAGLDVRVLYDDAGCMDLLPRNYPETLKKLGISCRVFNRLYPRPLPRFNHRDHRKLLIIDGVVGFTGGINIGDEYINAASRIGHWKDASVMLYGEAVFSMTLMFLQLWDYPDDTPSDVSRFVPRPYPEAPFSDDGFLQPFGDMPIGKEAVGHQIYLNMISRARHSILIATPYLIPDEQLSGALCLAAKSGVEVCILTPRQGDRWFVHMTTRAHYLPLLCAGVHIYEYTPGFIHSKLMVTDDTFAVVGSINFDYRSLFLHFECGVWMFRCRAVAAIRDDFLATRAQCIAITQKEMEQLPWFSRLAMGFFRLFSPLM